MAFLGSLGDEKMISKKKIPSENLTEAKFYNFAECADFLPPSIFFRGVFGAVLFENFLKEFV